MKNRGVFYISIIVSLISLILAFNKVNHWYFPATISIWLFFDCLSSNKNTTFQIFQRNKKLFFKLYFAMFLLGCSIEIIGRFILNFWTYPHINSIAGEIILILSYPFILISFREMYMFLKDIIKDSIFTFITSMILGIIIWEIPNMYSSDWIYTLPFTTVEIFNLNILVIFGWIMLIGLPLYIYKEFFKLN